MNSDSLGDGQIVERGFLFRDPCAGLVAELLFFRIRLTKSLKGQRWQAA